MISDALIPELIADLLHDGHSVRFTATGDSMDPTIHSGERLQVRAAEVSALRPGDVVLVQAPRGLTAHRVLSIDARTVITRGDNIPFDDPPLPLTTILGKVTAVERNGTFVPLGRAVPRWLARARWWWRKQKSR